MIRPIKPQPHGRVWDPLVRLTHWTIALAIILNGSVIGENAQAHIWIGYIALGFLALRLFWGVIGPKMRGSHLFLSVYPPRCATFRV